MAIEFSATEFGDRLRNERQRLALTQEQVAELIGITKQSVLQYEKGNSSPNIELLLRFGACGFNLQFLLFGRERVPKAQELPPGALKFAADIVTDIESRFVDEPLSNETRLQIMLVLLQKYLEQPDAPPPSFSQTLALLTRR